MATFDAIMIGGGAMGCATAYYLLKTDPTLKVAIIEKDPSYRYNSTILSDGNLRVQFNIEENIRISQYGKQVLATFADDMAVGDQKPSVNFQQQGNLFLRDADGVVSAKEGLERQNALGCDVQWLSADDVQERFSFIDKNTIAGGTYSTGDGVMDPEAILQGYKNKAVDLGATYIVGEVVDVLMDNQAVTGVQLADGTVHHSAYVVNGAGAWGTEITRKVGVELPMQPIMRHVFHIETTVYPDMVVPLTVFPSGVYLIHERDNHFTCAKSVADDPISFDFTFNRQRFVDTVWEDLMTYVPEMVDLKINGGWTGLYAVNTMDGNALLGELSTVRGFLFANGFSGHGFQQCHAVGRYLAEMIRGVAYSLDLSIFSPERILTDTPVFEDPHKLV